jgi:hypothetical protein
MELGLNDDFIKVEEIASDSNDEVYVTDSYQFSVKKFNNRGILKAEFGKRGKNPGEFKSFPFKIDCLADTLALVEVGSSKIELLTSTFTSLGEIPAGGPIVDIAFNRSGLIYAGMMPLSRRKEDVVMLYDKSGAVVSKVPLTEVRGEPAFDMVHLAVDPHDNLVVAYRYVNNISIYGPRQEMIRSFRVSGFPDQSASQKSKYEELGSLPEGDMIKDVAVDQRGHIFVLGGDYAKQPGRDVFVYAYDGTLMTTFTLPDKSGILHLDTRGYLYTRERQRSVVKKYKLDYVNF